MGEAAAAALGVGWGRRCLAGWHAASVHHSLLATCAGCNCRIRRERRESCSSMCCMLRCSGEARRLGAILRIFATWPPRLRAERRLVGSSSQSPCNPRVLRQPTRCPASGRAPQLSHVLLLSRTPLLQPAPAANVTSWLSFYMQRAARNSVLLGFRRVLYAPLAVSCYAMGASMPCCDAAFFATANRSIHCGGRP